MPFSSPEFHGCYCGCVLRGYDVGAVRERPIPVTFIDTFQEYRVSNLWCWYRLTLALIASYLFLSEIGIVPSICAEVLESLVSCEPNIVQPSVNDQPKCPPHLKVKKKSFTIYSTNAGNSDWEFPFRFSECVPFNLLPQETAISVEAHTVGMARGLLRKLRYVSMEHKFPFVTSQPAKRDYLFRISVSPRHFPLGRPKKWWSIYIATGISGVFKNGKQPETLVIGRKYDYE